MITQEQFEELLTLPHELPNVEFKGPGLRSDSYLLAKVAKAVMGMANKEGGGFVIVGVEERNGLFRLIGLTPEEVASWRNSDNVIDAFARYMSPPANIQVNIRSFDGKEFVLVEVAEFADVPIICKKEYFRDHTSYREVLMREGACYVRSRHKAETVELSSVERMRELLNLAVKKGVHKFVTQAHQGGMVLLPEDRQNNRGQFLQQIQAWNPPLLEQMRSRGHWQVIIRPAVFVQDRIAYARLLPLLNNIPGDFPRFRMPDISSLDLTGVSKKGSE